MDGGLMGIVMEYAELGALGGMIKKLSQPQKIQVSLGIVDGLSYLHSKHVAHRDLKPDNVLLFGDAKKTVTAKISDFGTSKVIQTMVTNTSMAGTPKYTAPELLDEGQKYGASADIFSLAMVLFELFTERDPFPNCTLMQVLAALLRNKRPEIPPKSMPDKMVVLVKRGWSTDPSNRPGLEEFRNALAKLKKNQATSVVAPLVEVEMKQETVRVVEQAREVSVSTQPVPLISMRWQEGYDELDSAEQRLNMVKNLRQRSHMSNLFTPSVLKAMEAVPRHKFLEPSRYGQSSRQDQITLAYTHNKAMGATATTNESSPEIIGIQLSLVKVAPGAHVLMVGGKGGYINSLVAQLAGVNGRVVTVSAKQDVLNTCRTRVQESPLARTMAWNAVSEEELNNPDRLASVVGESGFHAVIYCGAVDSMPHAMSSLLVPSGSLVAPVKVGSSQQMQVLTVAEEGDAGATRLRRITEFGVIFEDIK